MVLSANIVVRLAIGLNQGREDGEQETSTSIRISLNILRRTARRKPLNSYARNSPKGNAESLSKDGGFPKGKVETPEYIHENRTNVVVLRGDGDYSVNTGI